MKKYRWIQLLSNPFLQAGIFFIVLVCVIPDFLPEYKLRLMGKRNVPETTCVVYRDLDNDSVSEEILVTQEEKEYYTVMVLSRGKILYQWRIRGQLSPGDFLCFGDRDRDGCEEIYMDGIFDFEVSTGPDADLQRYIPKTLVFTFVENAVKYGIRSLEGKAGRISLTLGPEKGNFRIRIEDNGIGRGKAAEHKGQSTGKGLEIIDDMLSLYQAMENTKIHYRIEDLYPGAEYPGTRVEIILPG
ncbi:MAG: hypothetical protein R6T99_04230 [Bacteroidales bacterium]